MADIIDYEFDDNEFATEPEKESKAKKSPPREIKRKGRGFERGKHDFRCAMHIVHSPLQ